MQAVAVATVKATWAWVRGKCEEAMREVLGAGLRHRRWRQWREERRGWEQRAMKRATEATGYKSLVASCHCCR